MHRIICLLLFVICSPAAANEADRFREDAQSIEKLIEDNYAYNERLPGGRLQLSQMLRAEAAQVNDKRSLLRYAERVLFTLADHHAIAGASLSNSWAVVPSYSDLWIEKKGALYIVDAVRSGSPSEQAGLREGDILVGVAGTPIEKAVGAFWSDLGLESTSERDAFAARVLVAGRRDQPRALTFKRGTEPPKEFVLTNLYISSPAHAPIAVTGDNRNLIIKINDALGDTATIAAFDEAMAKAKPRQQITIDLTNTSGGGNTVVARGLMGWFVTKPTAYQVHRLPREERQSGVPRQWIEQVLPRAGKHHKGPVVIHVGRWTGSMGEGLAIGFSSIGAKVTGDRMAGLLGAIYDYKLPASGIVVKLPTERLMSVEGVARENFVPKPK